MLPFLDVAFRSIKKQCYDDIADRLNYYYSVLILLFLAILVSAKQYVGQPIQCWVPAQFRGGWEQYAESYCFVQNTYFLPFDKSIPADELERDYRKIGYYQWVPIVLAIQAVLFYLPNMIWKWFHEQSGINVKSILRIATDSAGFDPDKRQKNVQTLARYIEETLALQSNIEQNRDHMGFLFARYGIDRRRFGSYLCCLYLFVKCLYVVNACGQLFLLNAFLGTNYTFWGAQMLADLSRGREWQESGHFPRVTMCDFVVRELGQTQKHTIQCVLMINMFNEKIYLFVWFWLIFVAITTIGNLLWWLVSCWPTASRRLIQKYLRVSHYDTFHGALPADRRQMDKFVRSELRPDGVLLLRFISGHAGDLLTTELAATLFKDYIDRQQTRALKPSSNGLDSVDGDKKGIYYNRQNHVDDGGFTEADGEKDTSMLMMNGYLGTSPSAPSKENGTLRMTPMGTRPNGVETRGGYPGPPPPPPTQGGQGPKSK